METINSAISVAFVRRSVCVPLLVVSNPNS